MVVISLRMPERLLVELDELARRRCVSRSRLLRGLAEDALDLADESPSTPELLAEISAAQDEELERLRLIVRG